MSKESLVERLARAICLSYRSMDPDFEYITGNPDEPLFMQSHVYWHQFTDAAVAIIAMVNSSTFTPTEHMPNGSGQMTVERVVEMLTCCGHPKYLGNPVTDSERGLIRDVLFHLKPYLKGDGGFRGISSVEGIDAAATLTLTRPRYPAGWAESSIMGERHTESKDGEAERNECDCLRRPDSEGMPAGLKPASPATIDPREISVVDLNARQEQVSAKIFEAIQGYSTKKHADYYAQIAIDVLSPYLRQPEPVSGDPYDKIEDIMAEFGDNPAECLSIIGEHIGLARHYKLHPKASQHEE